MREHAHTCTHTVEMSYWVVQICLVYRYKHENYYLHTKSYIYHTIEPGTWQIQSDYSVSAWRTGPSLSLPFSHSCYLIYIFPFLFPSHSFRVFLIFNCILDFSIHVSQNTCRHTQTEVVLLVISLMLVSCTGHAQVSFWNLFRMCVFF